MATLRLEERWVAACIDAALPGVAICQYDDGSHDGMHDLDIIRNSKRLAAVEVTAAADAASIELWNLMNGNSARWIESDLVGGWFVSLLPSARAKRVSVELPKLLHELERLGISNIWGDRFSSERLERMAGELGITSASHGPTSFQGSIYITLDLGAERSGGFVADTGDALASWVGRWLREPKQSDNLRKLKNSGADERHIFVIFPGLSVAPFSVTDLLMRNDAPLPTVPPDLPPEVTHLWAMSTWSTGDGFHWSPDGSWSRFTKVLDIGPSPAGSATAAEEAPLCASTPPGSANPTAAPPKSSADASRRCGRLQDRESIME